MDSSFFERVDKKWSFVQSRQGVNFSDQNGTWKSCLNEICLTTPNDRILKYSQQEFLKTIARTGNKS